MKSQRLRLAQARQGDRPGIGGPSPAVGLGPGVGDQWIELGETLEVALDRAGIDGEARFLQAARKIAGRDLAFTRDGPKHFEKAEGLIAQTSVNPSRKGSSIPFSYDPPCRSVANGTSRRLAPRH